MVFVGGLHRSGTTPFSKLLGEHPEVSGLVETGVQEDEGQHLQSVYPPARVHGGAGRFALAEAAHLTEESSTATPESAASLLASWAPYWEDPDRRLLLEKSPPNILMGRWLQAVFPGSALIVVVRHPVIVALSTVKWRRALSRHFWNYTSVPDMVRNWASAMRVLEADRPHLKRVHVLRYEDLIADPEPVLSDVADFLGLASTPSAAALDGSRSRLYEERWQEMLASRRGRRMLEQLNRDFGADADRMGYDLETLQAR